MLQFQLGTRNFNYTCREHKFWSKTERVVEVSLIQDFLRHHAGNRLFEIGNVSYHWIRPRPQHLVVDLFEKPAAGQKNYVNADVMTWIPPGNGYDALLSVSTLEHVQATQQEKLERVLSWAPDVLITLPAGYRTEGSDLTQVALRLNLDAHLRVLQRKTLDNQWEEIDLETARSMSDEALLYGQPFPYANIVMVLTKGTWANTLG